MHVIIGGTVALCDERFIPLPTIRHTSCKMILKSSDGIRCRHCDEYRYFILHITNVLLVHRSTLHALAGKERTRKAKTLSSSHINDRFLSTPEKKCRITAIRQKNKALKLHITS